MRVEPMSTIQNILFPVGLAASCVALAPYVKRAAAIFRARVTLVHVFDLYDCDAVELYVRPLASGCRRAAGPCP